ncbi:MAG: hypothetical protein J6W29_00285 [Neisseriaceae bacterium]|nr:hypothetical protein [Neisseriaceae bacterium]
MKQKLQDRLQEYQTLNASFRDFFTDLKLAADKLDIAYKETYKQQVHSCETSILYALGRIADTLPELDIIISAIENKKQEMENKKQEKEDDRKD